jgi:tRNA 2-(methylsulfanyl)-N6-isopentenyladenosine37 hydroxylase
LGRERKDLYVQDLLKFMKNGGRREANLVEKLLFAALIEARSCERFRILSEQINDKELSEFYRELMISEANHYTTFITLARKYGKGVDVDARWEEFLEYEAGIMKNYSKKETMHG